MLLRGSIEPSTSTRKILTNCSTTCGTLPKTSRNSRQRSKRARTRSSVRAILANTNQENNHETQDYVCGAHVGSRNPQWLRRGPAKQVLSADRCQRSSGRRGSVSLRDHSAAWAHHLLASVSGRPYRLHVQRTGHGHLRIPEVG